MIAIEDHGIGIEPEVLTHIFDRFYHLDQNADVLFSGMGLGLSIAHQVIEQHHGKIEVTSKPGRGSTFTLILQVWMGKKEKT
jgi:signal transduction histidine kinase